MKNSLGTKNRSGLNPASITVITDCFDDNAKSRQTTRIASLFPNIPTAFVGVKNTLEAAGNIVDALDALYDAPGIILANVAPRNGYAKRWANGTPFGYAWVYDTLIISTIDGYTFSLLKKLDLIKQVNVTDISTVIDELIQAGIIDKSDKEAVLHTQFRSLNYMPRLAKYIWNGNTPKTEELTLTDIPDAPTDVWWIDNFGNRKTTLLRSDIKIEQGIARTKLGELSFYNRLKDVPDGEEALIEGSSGYKDKRFLEIVKQGV